MTRGTKEVTSTTEIGIVRKNPHSFTWGPVSDIYDIGTYTIARFLDKYDLGTDSYHCWVDGVDTGRSVPTLEDAMLVCIAHGTLDKNEADQAARSASILMGLRNQIRRIKD